MQAMVIHSLPLTGNCMQSEGELRFGISLYEIFASLDFRFFDGYFCNSIEEYCSQTDRWREVGEVNLLPSVDDDGIIGGFSCLFNVVE